MMVGIGKLKGLIPSQRKISQPLDLMNKVRHIPDEFLTCEYERDVQLFCKGYATSDIDDDIVRYCND